MNIRPNNIQRNDLDWDVDVGFRQWRNDLPIFLRSNDVNLDVLHDEIKLNNEVANF